VDSVWDRCELYPPSEFPHSGFHYVLRKDPGKTVVLLQNSFSPAAFATTASESDKTPQGRQTLDQLFSLTYGELRRLAATVTRGPGNTLSPTGLVNEAWLKLAKAPGFARPSLLCTSGASLLMLCVSC
jgi:hypothetical protein